MGVHGNTKLGGRWCVLVPPGALGPDGAVSVEWFGIRTRSKSEAKRLSRHWNREVSWRPKVRRYSRRFREICGEGDLELMDLE